jgi:hypothetical protein
MGVNLLDGGYVVRRSVGEDQRSGVGHSDSCLPWKSEDKRIMRRAWRQGKLGFLMLKIKKSYTHPRNEKMAHDDLRHAPGAAASSIRTGEKTGLAAHEVRHRLLQVA